MTGNPITHNIGQGAIHGEDQQGLVQRQLGTLNRWLLVVLCNAN